MNTTNKKAFTLIEMLVVVLIIGILAAIALPQYQKSVQKTRGAQLYTLVKSFVEAQKRYYLINGEYSTKFDNFDITLEGATKPSATSFGHSVSSTDAVRRFDNFEITLNINSTAFNGVIGTNISGKYKSSGIAYYFLGNSGLPLNQLHCFENTGTFTQPAGSYCQEIMGFKTLKTTAYSARYYVQ